MTEKKTEAAAAAPSTALVKIAEASLIEVTPQTVKDHINAKATAQEVALFLNQCAMFQLNPFKREIYLIKYKDNEPATFVVGYEVYLKRAERTRNWGGLSSGTEDGPDGKPIKAWADVFRKDWTRPLHHEVFYDEYVGLKDEWVNNQRTGKKVPTRFWADKPKTMLKKVAIAQALRMAFPDEMAGMPYIEEEIHADSGASQADIVGKILNDGYEASKRRPVSNVEDEFSAPEKHPLPASDLPKPAAPPPAKPAPDPEPEIEDEDIPFADEVGADTAEDHKKPAPKAFGPTMAQLERFGRLKADLAAMGVGEQDLWKGIHKFTEESFGAVKLELSEFSPMEMDLILDRITRWKAAKEKLIKADEKAKGKKS